MTYKERVEEIDSILTLFKNNITGQFGDKITEAETKQAINKLIISGKIEELGWVGEFAKEKIRQKAIRYPDYIRGHNQAGQDLKEDVDDRIKQLKANLNNRGK